MIWSSFPCQAFSQAGSRKGEADERNGWPWTVDAIDRFKPRWFVAENVRGLLSMPYLQDTILPDLRKRFRHVGYWVLDAADFGVPQRRRRVFLWAGEAPLRPPVPTHGSPEQVGQVSLFRAPLLPWVSMGEALGLVGQKVLGGGRKTQAAGIERTYRDITDEPSTCVTAVQVGNAGPWVLHHQRNTDANPNQERPTPVSEPAPTIGGKGNQMLEQLREPTAENLKWLGRPAPTVTTTEVKGTRGDGMHGGPDRAFDALYLATRPPPTVTTADGQGVGSADSRDILQATIGRRRLTVEECAILQDFPDGYPWHAASTKTARYRAIGNAVPPKLAEVVGRVVMEADSALAE